MYFKAVLALALFAVASAHSESATVDVSASAEATAVKRPVECKGAVDSWGDSDKSTGSDNTLVDTATKMVHDGVQDSLKQVVDNVVSWGKTAIQDGVEAVGQRIDKGKEAANRAENWFISRLNDKANATKQRIAERKKAAEKLVMDAAQAFEKQIAERKEAAEKLVMDAAQAFEKQIAERNEAAKKAQNWVMDAAQAWEKKIDIGKKIWVNRQTEKKGGSGKVVVDVAHQSKEDCKTENGSSGIKIGVETVKTGSAKADSAVGTAGNAVGNVKSASGSLTLAGSAEGQANVSVEAGSNGRVNHESDHKE